MRRMPSPHSSIDRKGSGSFASSHTRPEPLVGNFVAPRLNVIGWPAELATDACEYRPCSFMSYSQARWQDEIDRSAATSRYNGQRYPSADRYAAESEDPLNSPAPASSFKL